MKIQVDWNTVDWNDVSSAWSEQDFRIVEDFWEDDSEWAHIEILNTKWATWIALKHPDWIIDGPK